MLNNALKKCPDDEPFQFFVFSPSPIYATPYVHTLFIVTFIQESFFFFCVVDDSTDFHTFMYIRTPAIVKLAYE